MDRDRRKGAHEKPVVIVRKKAGKGSAPTGPTQPPAHPSSPVQKAVALADSPQPPAEPPPPVPSQPPPVPALGETGPSKKQREKQARRELLDVLRDRWPKAFPLDSQQVKPLAIGISRDIAAHLPEQPRGRISSAIGIFQHLMGPGYYRAILRGGLRYDLEGQPRGEVTPAEQEQAKRELTAFFERRQQGQRQLAADKAGSSSET